jgi:hypothetical protein
MAKRIHYTLLLVLFWYFGNAQHIASHSVSDDLFFYYNSELEKLEKEIAVEEAEYSATQNQALLASLNGKKVKREVLGILASKFVKRSNINLNNSIGFSRVNSDILEIQKELEEKYDLKINFIVDEETIKETSGLGVKLLNPISKNETAVNNRKIDVSVHYYKDQLAFGFAPIFSQPLATELSSKPTFEEHTYLISGAGNIYVSKFFAIDFKDYLKNLSLVLNPSNIAELEKLKNSDNTFSFISPSGVPFTLPANNLKSVKFYFNDKAAKSTDPTAFRADGALQGFTYESGASHIACYNGTSSTNFLGYFLNIQNTTDCIGDPFEDELSKTCSQKDCVIVATACINDGVLKFQVKKIPLENKTIWPTSKHTGAGKYLTPLPVRFDLSGKTAELSDYTFSSQYNSEAMDFLKSNNTCQSSYVPYIISIANVINALPVIYRNCYSKNWFISNFALFNCENCTTGTYLDNYKNRVNTMQARLEDLGRSPLIPANNSLLTSLTSPSALYDYIADYNQCDFNFLNNAQRVHILRVFSSSTINDNFERSILSILDGMGEDPSNINAFLNALIDPQNNVNGKCILYRMFDDFDDLMDDGYSHLVNKISKLVAKSTLPNIDLPNYSVYTQMTPQDGANKYLFFWDDCYKDVNKTGQELDCNGWTKGTTRYKKIEILPTGSVHIESETKDYQDNLNGNGKVYWNYVSRNYDLNPYQLIAFADNSLLHEIDETNIGEGNPVIVPACFLEYADYNAKKKMVLKNAAIASDLILMATGVGELSIGYKAYRAASGVNKVYKGIRLGWTGMQMAGAGLNLTINLNGADEEFKGFVDKYNMLVIGLSLPSICKGLVKLSNGPLQYAGNTYNNVAYLITEKAALLSTNKILQKELLTRLVVYNFKLNEANAVKALQNQALLAESNYLTNNYIKVFHKAAYEEAELTKGAFVLKEGYLIGKIIPKTVDEIKHLIVSDNGKSFFWSGITNGIGGEVVALEIATSKGGITLEGLLKNKNIELPAWNPNNASVMKLWEDVSSEYAKQVSGVVRGIIGQDLRVGNIWQTKELPALMNNDNVTQIITIDPQTLVETIIFTR